MRRQCGKNFRRRERYVQEEANPVILPSFAALGRRAAGDNRGSIKYRLPLGQFIRQQRIDARVAFEGFTLEFDQVKTIVNAGHRTAFENCE
jgi:hypothetical protein